MATLLTSDWGAEKSGLNPHLIAKIYPVDKDGKAIDGEDTVAAPLTDGNLEITLNWSSPFENSGTDSKLPAITQLLQSGQAATMLTLMSGLLAGLSDDPNSKINKAKNAIAETAKQAATLENRTGITKLNSRQIFTGLPPIKLPVTLYFRAWKDAKSEVEAPIDQLHRWALPQKLADISSMEDALKQLTEGNVPNLMTLFPSSIPLFVALEYGGRVYKPLVIESISHALVTPRTSTGDKLTASVQLTLATLEAWGKADWDRSENRPPMPVVTDGEITQF